MRSTTISTLSTSSAMLPQQSGHAARRSPTTLYGAPLGGRRPVDLCSTSSRGIHVQTHRGPCYITSGGIPLAVRIVGSRRLASKQASAAAPKSRYAPLPPGWEAVIGVESHVQLRSPRKLFSAAPMPALSTPPNTSVAAFDAALPGSLPRLSQQTLHLALRACEALGCQVRRESRFDRKHYFYADLTCGYQITQRYSPLGKSGKVRLLFDDGHLPSVDQEVDVAIEQVQLEQDTAKSVRIQDSTGAESTLLDLNRAGAGLVEIVSGPQMRTPEQAGAYVRKLQTLLRKVGASDGNMAEGSLRCDVNVSVRRKGDALGTRCEVKNVNGVRFIMNAIAHEIQRQLALLDRGEEVRQETRGYNEADGTTFSLRSKEDSPDYRYMPDPNLPPLRIDEETLAEIRRSMPELPDATRQRLGATYGLPVSTINVLLRLDDDDEGCDGANPVGYFERLAQGGRDAETVANWIVQDVARELRAKGVPFSAGALPAPDALGALIDLVTSGKMTGTAARQVLSFMVGPGRDEELAGSSEGLLKTLEARHLLGIDGGEAWLASLSADVVAHLPKEAEAFRAGKTKVIMRLVGEGMKRAKGRADPQKLRQALERAALGEKRG